jgi:class 3 adenylate cyclase
MSAEPLLHLPTLQALKDAAGADFVVELQQSLQRFATRAVAQDLIDSGFALGGRLVQATVLFCDIRGFTGIAEAQSPAETIELLNAYYTLMFDAIEGQGGVVNQIIGDGLMAIFGAPLALDKPALSATLAAQEMVAMGRSSAPSSRLRGGRRCASAWASPAARSSPATPAPSSAPPTPAWATR